MQSLSSSTSSPALVGLQQSVVILSCCHLTSQQYRNSGVANLQVGETQCISVNGQLRSETPFVCLYMMTLNAQGMSNNHKSDANACSERSDAKARCERSQTTTTDTTEFCDTRYVMSRTYFFMLSLLESLLTTDFVLGEGLCV